MPVAAPKMAKEEDAHMFLSPPFYIYLFAEKNPHFAASFRQYFLIFLG